MNSSQAHSIYLTLAEAFEKGCGYQFCTPPRLCPQPPIVRVICTWTVHASIAGILLLIGLTFFQPNAMSQQPTTVQQAPNQDCAKIKEEIQQLQDLMAQTSAEMQKLRELLDQVNNDVTRLQADVKFFSGPGFSESARGETLDMLAKAMGVRKDLQQKLEDDVLTIQAIKDEIADLLNKLANCAPPSSAQPPQQETPQAQPPPAPTPPPAKPASTQPAPDKSVSMSGFTPTFQLRGFGGASFINGNTPPSAGFDGAVLFPLGNHVLVGPTAGFQWVNSSIVNTIGSMTPGSTFINTSVGFKSGNFGGRIAFPLGGWQLGIHGGATVASSAITQATGFCGLGNATSPAGCTVTSSTNTHDTVAGSFVGGYVSHTIFPHVGVFVGYDYYRPLKDTKPNPTNPTGPSVTVFDLHGNNVVGGLVLSFGRHK